MALVTEGGRSALTMEGIAARAQVSKQTLYRSWPSPAAILFDALLARSTDDGGDVEIPDTGDLAADLGHLLDATVAELYDPAADRVLRAVTAELQSDDALPAELRDRLLRPQLAAVRARLERGGVPARETGDDEVVELLYGPLVYRWLLRSDPPAAGWAARHVARVLAAVGAPGTGCAYESADYPGTAREESGGPG